MFDRRLVLIAMLAIMTTIAMMPAGALAQQTQAAGNSGTKTTFKQEYTYKEGETPNIHEEITQFGQIFTLVSVSEPVASASLPASRSYTSQVSANYTPEQLSQAPKNVKLTPVYGMGKRQVDRKEKIPGLPDNDVDRLKQRKTYTDTNGRGPGASARGELVLAEVKYEPTGWDEYGIPNKYTAHVVYRGEESYMSLLYYRGTTTYTKTFEEEGVTTYTVVATYEGEAPVSAEPGEASAGVGGDSSGGAGVIGEGAGAAAGEPAVTDPAGEPGAAGTEGAAAASSGRTFTLPFSLGTLSPLGTAAVATMAAAILSLVFVSIYNRRKLRETT